MKTKPTLAIVVSAMLLTALTGSGKAIPISIDGTIPFSRSSKNKDTNFEDAANFINFGTVKEKKAGTVSGNHKSTAGAAVIFKPSTGHHVDASSPTKKSSKSRKKKNAVQLGSPGVDPLSPSSWVLSGFGTAPVSGPGLENQANAGFEILTGQRPVEPSLTLSPPTILPYPSTQTVHTLPDGGATALILGFSICGLGWLKRKCSV